MALHNTSDFKGHSLDPEIEEMIECNVEHHSPVPPVRTEDDNGRPGLAEIDLTSAPAVLRYSEVKSTGHAPPRPDLEKVLRPTKTAPTDRFRATVRKVIAMNRTASSMMNPNTGGVGAEPGVDPRRASANIRYGRIKQRCVIEVVDYSTMRTSFGRMTNHEFIKMLRDPGASERESWVKVRWINVSGLSWDVISALALKYDMHPLAIEDVLSQRRHNRSKVDYYPHHLFMRVLCHSLLQSDESGTPKDSFTGLPRSESPDFIGIEESDDEEEIASGVTGNEPDEQTLYGSASGSRFSTKATAARRRLSALDTRDVEDHALNTYDSQVLGWQSKLEEQKKKISRNMKLILALKRGQRVNVKIHPICIFLFRDGTVISINNDNNPDFTVPITERLRQRHTGLRTTADPSLLVQSLLDLMVDRALEVVEEYQTKILRLEEEVLLRPNMQTVQRLHVLQGDLILHRRTLEPIKTVIYGLRRYDDDRASALIEKVDPNMRIEGFMSHKAKVYLADVHDHMEYILSSMDMFAGVSENLINYTFNMASYQMNEVMRRLTMATIIFLPLTLLTGYFGMNFQNMWSVNHGHSDVIFWEIALPVMAFIIPVFMWPDIKNMAHYLRKRLMKQKLTQAYRRRGRKLR